MSAPGKLGLNRVERGLVDDRRVGFLDEVAWQLASVGMTVRFCHFWPIVLLQNYAAGVDFVFEPFTDRLPTKLGSAPGRDPFSIQLGGCGFGEMPARNSVNILLMISASASIISKSPSPYW